MGLWHHNLEFGQREYREELEEQQEQCHEDPARADEGQDVYPSREEHVPFTRQERAMNRGDDNHESFKPHPNSYCGSDNPDDEWALTHFAEPEDLRETHITDDHGPVRPPIGCLCWIHTVVGEYCEFIFVRTVPRHEELHRIRETHHRTGK